MVVTGNMVLEEGHERPIAVVAHHPRPPMMWCGLLLKSFAGFRLLGVIQWPLDYVVGVDATILRHVPTTAGTITDDKDSHSMVLRSIKLCPIMPSTIRHANEMSFMTTSEVEEVNSMKIRTIFSLLGGKIDYVSASFGYYDHITAVACYHLSDMISGGGLMRSFDGFLHVIVVRWLSECSWRASPRISGSPIGTLEVLLDHHNG